MSEKPDNTREVREDATTDASQGGPRGDMPNATRRHLIQGAAATPLIMTLASRPVWGSQGRCSLSGDIFSANVSNIDHECTSGQGCSPRFWRDNYLAWACTGMSPGDCESVHPQHGYCQTLDATVGTPFSAVFNGYTPQSCNSSHTLMEVLQHCPGSLEWHAVGAALNAACDAVYFGATRDEVVRAYDMARRGETSTELLREVFENMNNRGCPMDAQRDCNEGFTRNSEGRCIKVKTSRNP
jgi:hypothetical protein